jgi:hypothetical protein
MTTNLISNSGAEWAENYKTYKNHMYITQWIVIDYNVLHRLNKDKSDSGKKFLRKADTTKYSGLVNLVEEVPGSILTNDITSLLLKQSYFGSFNLSYFTEHQKIIGLRQWEKIDFTSEKYNPRYYILKSLHKNVHDIYDFASLIQYNGYKNPNPKIKNDPSFNDPSNGISSRDDISNNDPHGGVDFKIVSSDLVNKMTIYTYGGPTYNSNPNIKPFDFKQISGTEYDNFHKEIPKESQKSITLQSQRTLNN